MNTERQKAALYLEQLQRKVYQNLKVPPPVSYFHSQEGRDFNDKFLLKFYKSLGGTEGEAFEVFRQKILEDQQNAIKDTPTIYEEPAWHSLLKRMCEEIENVLRSRGVEAFQSPIFGTLPTKRVNGMAIAVPKSSYRIILFENGLFGFANLVCKAVARAFPLNPEDGGEIEFSTSNEDWEKELSEHPEICERFLDVLMAYLIYGDPHRAKSYLPDRKYDVLTSILRDSMELFILGHEYGHIVSGHLEQENTQKAKPLADDVSEIPTDWQQEFEADVRGLELMLAVMMNKGYDLALSFWGADLFFGCIDLVERSLSILREGTVTENLSDTHPPTLLRRELLREVLRNSSPEQYAEGAIQLSTIIQGILEYFWVFCEPILKKAYEAKTEIAPIWRVQ
jgi:hypothetical protein